MRVNRAGACALLTIVTMFGGGVLSGGVTAAASGSLGIPDAKASASPAPEGLPGFYAVPKTWPSKKPGTLIKSQRITIAGAHGTVYRVMYVSTSQQGKAVPVTGLVIVPDAKAPKAGYPVVSWAHGTNGLADVCAPSIAAASDPATANAMETANVLLDAGYLFTATDYLGEGTPGLHPYIAGESAARNTIDIVRAARQLKAAHAGHDYVVWGHSQGGHTAMWAVNIASKYAPELSIHGVVAGAPPSQFALLYTALKNGPFRHYLLMATGGLNAAFGDERAPLDQVLKPAGLALLPELENGCGAYLRDTLGSIVVDDVLIADPFTVPAWREVLAADDPQSFTTRNDIPLLIIHGGDDEQIPTVSSQILASHFCDIGQSVERWVYPGQKHAAVVPVSLPDMVSWIDARFADDDPGSVTPVGQTDVQVTGCPA
jgi:pimeloyl-ACP methyl ester carboxylesterase